MNNKELLEMIAAEEAGKKIEYRLMGLPDKWEQKDHTGWATQAFEYRIAPEQVKKEGKWVRKEIELNRFGEYACNHEGYGIPKAIDELPRIPGFGGIEYHDPRNPEVPPVMSSSPVCFNERGNWFIAAFIPGSDMNSLRPGVPVAAWFWEE